MNRMYGDLIVDGRTLFQAGFQPSGGYLAGPSQPALTRGALLTDEQRNQLASIQRGDFTGDLSDIVSQLGLSLAQFERAITTSTSGFPVRENLEAPAQLLVPDDTPVRNLLPRVPGKGLASAWRQITSLGGGWGSGYDQPGGGSAIQAFYAESGAPQDHATAYAAKSAPYKLLGTYGSVTGFAMAAGQSYQDQLATEKRNAIMNLMLNEENALINGNSTSSAAPWGDGSNALAFDGLINLVSTANGTPSAQIQSSVGALTTAHLDLQLNSLWIQGGRDLYMVMNVQESTSLVHLAEADGSIIRIVANAVDGKTVLGVQVTGFLHNASRQIVPIHTSRFLSAGTILFGSQRTPDGRAAADVDVLPQVEAQGVEPTKNIQGYVATDLARTTSAPDVHPFMVSVYEVLRLKSALHFAQSTGVTAV